MRGRDGRAPQSIGCYFITYIPDRLGSGLGDRAARVCRRGSGRRRAARGGARRKANRIFIYHYRHSSTSSGSYFFCLTHITRDSDNYTFRLSLDSVTLSSTSVVLELRFIAVLGGPRSQSQPCLAAALLGRLVATALPLPATLRLSYRLRLRSSRG